MTKFSHHREMSALASCRFPFAESPPPGGLSQPHAFLNSEPGETFVASLEPHLSSPRLLHHFPPTTFTLASLKFKKLNKGEVKFGGGGGWSRTQGPCALPAWP